MSTDTPTVSKAALWTGRVMSILPCLLLFMSAFMKFSSTAGAEEGFRHLGVPMSLAFGLGVLEATCALLYLIPRTAVLGAILLTGYLGGALMTHLRVGDPFWMQPLVGVVLWGGLWLRDPHLRALMPIVRQA